MSVSKTLPYSKEEKKLYNFGWKESLWAWSGAACVGVQLGLGLQ